MACISMRHGHVYSIQCTVNGQTESESWRVEERERKAVATVEAIKAVSNGDVRDHCWPLKVPVMARGAIMVVIPVSHQTVPPPANSAPISRVAGRSAGEHAWRHLQHHSHFTAFSSYLR